MDEIERQYRQLYFDIIRSENKRQYNNFIKKGKKMIYLGGAIDGLPETSIKTLNNYYELENKLVKKGFEVFNPHKNAQKFFDKVNDEDKISLKIYRSDIETLEIYTDLYLVYIGKPSLGTGFELCHLLHWNQFSDNPRELNNKNILCYHFKEDKISKFINGFIIDKEIPVVQIDSLDELVNMVKNLIK